MERLLRAVVVLVLTGMSLPLHAQWLKHPTPGVPRSRDGAPDLSAPAPRTADGKPDFSGVWGLDAGPSLFWIAGDLKPGENKPWAEELVRNAANTWIAIPAVRCLPEGPRFNHFVALPKKIIQTPGLIVALSEDMTYRQIFLDGRALPKDPNPSFMGYSVGRWDGDTLVVDSVGFKERDVARLGRPSSQ